MCGGCEAAVAGVHEADVHAGHDYKSDGHRHGGGEDDHGRPCDGHDEPCDGDGGCPAECGGCFCDGAPLPADGPEVPVGGTVILTTLTVDLPAADPNGAVRFDAGDRGVPPGRAAVTVHAGLLL